MTIGTSGLLLPLSPSADVDQALTDDDYSSDGSEVRKIMDALSAEVRQALHPVPDSGVLEQLNHADAVIGQIYGALRTARRRIEEADGTARARFYARARNSS